jgi:TnpA family transposase
MYSTVDRSTRYLSYILRYIHVEELRRRVQLQLNRGESRHALARWLFFANRGEFRTATTRKS